jgi:hypothetical protein
VNNLEDKLRSWQGLMAKARGRRLEGEGSQGTKAYTKEDVDQMGTKREKSFDAMTTRRGEIRMSGCIAKTGVTA